MAEQRLIDANALDFNHINFDRCCFSEFDSGFICGAEEAIAVIENAPTVDAKPVVHAHWTNDDCCSHCGEEAIYFDERSIWIYTKCCPNCGAQMDEKEG